MFRSQNNKRPVETFIVQNSNDSIINLLDPDGSLINPTTSAVALDFTTPFMTGIVSPQYNPSGLIFKSTLSKEKEVMFVQSTNDTANLAQAAQSVAYPLTPQFMVSSTMINAQDEIIASFKDYEAPTNTVWVVGDTGAVATGAINVLDNTEYALTIAYRGNVIDRTFSPEATAFFTPSFTTPDYTALSTAQPLDHLVQNLVWKVNRNSIIAGNGYGNEPVVAIALDLTGTVGTDVSALTTGFLPLMNTSTGVRGITLNADLLATLQAALPSGSSVVTIDLTTAGTANAAQAFALVALDRTIAFADEVPYVKIDFDLGLRYGFTTTVHKEQTSFPFEGQNTYRQLSMWYNRTHSQRRYNNDHEQIPVIKYDNPIQDGKNYSVLLVESRRGSQVDTTNWVVSPQLTVYCAPKSTAKDTATLFDEFLIANNKRAVLGLS